MWNVDFYAASDLRPYNSVRYRTRPKSVQSDTATANNMSNLSSGQRGRSSSCIENVSPREENLFTDALESTGVLYQRASKLENGDIGIAVK